MDVGASMTRRSPLFSRGGTQSREKRGPTREVEASQPSPCPRMVGYGAGAVSEKLLQPLFTCLSVTLLSVGTHLSDNGHDIRTL